MRPRFRLSQLGACLVGLGLGLGIGLLLTFGDIVPAVAALALAAALWRLLQLLVPKPQAGAVSWVFGLSYSGHLATLALLHYLLLALGREGHVTGDDFGYADLSWRLAQYLHGIPVQISWSAEAYLFGNFLWLETGLFYLFGPQVLLMKVLNAAFFAGFLLLLYDIARRLYSHRAAIVGIAAVAVYPSLNLWSVLNLKEATVLLLVGAILWSLVRYYERPRWSWLLAAYVTLAILESIRLYVFLLASLLVPFAAVLSPHLDFRGRLRYGAATLLASATIMGASGSGFLGANWFGVKTLAELEEKRAWMAAGARTAIEQSAGRPVLAQPGDTFVVVAQGQPVTEQPASPTTPPPTLAPAAVASAPTPSPTEPPASPSEQTAMPSAQPRPPPTQPPSPPTATVAAAPISSPSATSRVIVVFPGTLIVLASPTATPGTPSPSATVASNALATAAPTTAQPVETLPATPPPANTAPSSSAGTGVALVEATPARQGGGTPRRQVVYVNPGDIVVVAGGTPNLSSPKPLAIGGERVPPPEIRTANTLAAPSVLSRSIAYFPRGMTYVLLAPFPWSISTLSDLVAAPEMLLWYVLFACCLLGLWLARREWRKLLVIALYVLGIFVILALAEGNVGTIFRHRSMVIPFAVILAGPGLLALLRLRRHPQAPSD